MVAASASVVRLLWGLPPPTVGRLLLVRRCKKVWSSSVPMTITMMRSFWWWWSWWSWRGWRCRGGTAVRCGCWWWSARSMRMGWRRGRGRRA
ncbi:hypothetical protein DFJ73DRAFT_805389 [Zopfochytrium polystomum]|nr:hypothetical protein DFJ73DRAFT_805389 [Zopfochytrium polystomum]